MTGAVADDLSDRLLEGFPVTGDAAEDPTAAGPPPARIGRSGARPADTRHGPDRRRRRRRSETRRPRPGPGQEGAGARRTAASRRLRATATGSGARRPTRCTCT